MPRHSSRRRTPPNLKMLALALLLGVPAGTWMAASAVSGYQDFRAASHLEAWSFQTRSQRLQGLTFTPSYHEFDAALAHARLAVQLSPYKAEYHEHLGNILLWMHHAPPATQALAPEWRQQSLQAFREAIRLRPAWPDTYLRLARGKALLGEPDAEMDAALHQAARLAPWKPDIMFETLAIGLYHWTTLSPGQQQLVADTFIRTQQWQASRKASAWAGQHAFDLVVMHDKVREMCALVRRDIPDVAAFCQP